jgi:hypothetical protein
MRTISYIFLSERNQKKKPLTIVRGFCFAVSVFGFIVEHTMAKALVLGIVTLFAKLFAHTLVLLGTQGAAGAVTARAFETLADLLNDFGVGIQRDFHGDSSFGLLILAHRQGDE